MYVTRAAKSTDAADSENENHTQPSPHPHVMPHNQNRKTMGNLILRKFANASRTNYVKRKIEDQPKYFKIVNRSKK
jgi:hypothetical protein